MSSKTLRINYLKQTDSHCPFVKGNATKEKEIEKLMLATYKTFYKDFFYRWYVKRCIKIGNIPT